MPQPRTGRRATRVVAAAMVGMGVLAGCAGGGHTAPKASVPSAGQAGVVAEIGATGPLDKAVAAKPGTAGGPESLSSGADGSLYLSLPSYVVRVGPKGQVSSLAASSASAGAPRGVVALPDGSFVTVLDGQLLRMIPRQPTSAVAGVKGGFRSLSAPVPSGGPGRSVRLTRAAAPIGTLGDGSVVLADGDALWRLVSGKLNRLYQQPAVKGASGTYQPSLRADGATVSPTGSVFLLPGTGSADTLGDVVEISPSGTVSHLRLPSSVSGVSGDPAALTPLWLSTDGGTGVYVHAVRAGHGDYVLHVSGGKADLVVASTTSSTTTACGISKPTGATSFPCALPRAVVVQPGLMVMVGGEPYVVGVRMPKPKQ